MQLLNRNDISYQLKWLARDYPSGQKPSYHEKPLPKGKEHKHNNVNPGLKKTGFRGYPLFITLGLLIRGWHHNQFST